MPLKVTVGAVSNYVLPVGRGGGSSPKDDLLKRPYLIKKDDKVRRGSKIANFETT